MSGVASIEWYPAGGGPKLVIGPAWPYKLRDVQGIETTLSQPLSRKNPSQHGVTAVDVDIPARIVSVQLQVAAETEAELWEARRALSRALTAIPARPGADVETGILRLLRGGGLDPLEVEALPRNSPVGTKHKGLPLYEADLEFEAAYPFWRETSDASLTFAQADGGFEWDLEFPLEMIANNVEQEVDNTGDIDAPILVRLYGECTTARFINATTGETLEITGAIAADEYVEVNTAYGQKSVTLVDTGTGDRTNAMDRLNLDLADFWSLRPGINVVRFEADTNVSGSASLLWRQRYSGV